MNEIAAVAPDAAPRPRRRAALLLGLLLLIVIAGAWLGWHYVTPSQNLPSEIAALNARADTLTHGIVQLRGNADTLRARLDDGDKVDASVRQQLLALGERIHLAEDALANLADHRLSGHDTLALDEAESLLALGGERYRLFHDASAAIVAYRLADSALAGVDDAAFSTVRQSISGEIAALGGLDVADPAALSATLQRLCTQLSQWPEPARAPASAPTAAKPSGLTGLFDAFVQVRHDDAAPSQALLRGGAIARDLIELDLRAAQAAALARDATGYHSALADARVQIAATFDAQTPAVAAALRELDALDKMDLAPAPPAVLGAALKELRNLRATHALSAARTAAAKPAEVKK